MSVKRWNGTGWDTYAGAGVQGLQGTQGPSIQGTQGTTGTTGTQGTAGSNGSSGTSGVFAANIISSNGTTMATQNSYFVTTSAGAITLTLPSSPAVGAEIHVFDSTGSAATNNITVANNGSNINGQNTTLTIDSNYAAVNLVYVGSAYGWRVS